MGVLALFPQSGIAYARLRHRRFGALDGTAQCAKARLLLRQGLFAGQFLRRAGFDHFVIALRARRADFVMRREIALLLAERLQGAAQAFMFLTGGTILMFQAHPVEFEAMDLVAQDSSDGFAPDRVLL